MGHVASWPLLPGHLDLSMIQGLSNGGFWFIEATPDLEICFPTSINIVCFRYDPGGLPEPALKKLNTEIMVRMQEAGVAAVFDTTVRVRHCLRAAISNHRTTRDDLDAFVTEVVL